MVCLLLFAFMNGQAQTDWRLEGTIHDATNDLALPGASVFVNGSGVLTDIDGRFVFTGSTTGPAKVLVRYVGYIEWTETLPAWTGLKSMNIELSPDVASIGTAVVSAGRYEQDLGEVSVSIDVLPPELVNQGAPTSADQSLSRTPGVTIVDSEPQIRGGKRIQLRRRFPGRRLARWLARPQRRRRPTHLGVPALGELRTSGGGQRGQQCSVWLLGFEWRDPIPNGLSRP